MEARTFYFLPNEMMGEHGAPPDPRLLPSQATSSRQAPGWAVPFNPHRPGDTRVTKLHPILR